MAEYRYESYDGEFVDVEDTELYPRYLDVAGSTSQLPSDGQVASEAGDALMQFGVWYQGVHGYVCVVMCLFGIVSNAMNIAVLTRRSMVTIKRLFLI